MMGAMTWLIPPANLDWTIAVGALQASNDRAASYSNCGEELDCMGYTNIYVYDEKGRETMFTGTSCATPFVVGMLAVYMSKVGKKSREKLKQFIKENCVDVFKPGWDNRTGPGLFVLPDPDTVNTTPTASAPAQEDEGMEIKMNIGSPIAFIDGKPVELLLAPEAKNGVTLVPIRFIAETFGCQVLYDAATKGITIRK